MAEKATNGNSTLSPSLDEKTSLKNRSSNGTIAVHTITFSEVGRQVDKKLDEHQTYEFGGPVGVMAMMTIFPVLMYYLWICLEFYDGQIVYPTSLDDVQPFLLRMFGHAREHATPTWYTFKMFSCFVAYQLGIALVIPGYIQEGLPVPSLNYKTLKYNCNALACWYFTIVTVVVLHNTRVFRITEIIDNFGRVMSVAMIYGWGVSIATYVWAVSTGNAMRMSGNVPYDFFMGAALNPRLGSVDLKMWAEVRIPWMLLFWISVSGGVKQYEVYGQITPNMAFMILATGLYINACCKGEECIPQTWDMYHEKWGFMVIFWNFAGVPFTYCYSIIYMATHDPSKYQFSTPTYIALYTTLLTAYYVWDTCMAQKSRFRMQMQGSYQYRWTFPQLPWGTLKNPKYIQTAHGYVDTINHLEQFILITHLSWPHSNRLLISGWWAYLRKPNYTADWIMSLTWGLVVGTASPIPYFYSVFFICVLTHRCGRDFERCAAKYGDDWVEYCRIVKWRFIPYVY